MCTYAVSYVKFPKKKEKNENEKIHSSAFALVAIILYSSTQDE